MLMGMEKTQTSPYHPQTNNQCERFYSTQIGMLGTLPPERKSEWKNHIGTLVHAYNYTQNSAMGLSPYYLMYRRQPHLSIDVTLGLAPCTTTAQTTSKFVQKMRECANGPRKRLKPSKPKRPNVIKRTMTNEAKKWPWRLETWF